LKILGKNATTRETKTHHISHTLIINHIIIIIIKYKIHHRQLHQSAVVLTTINIDLLLSICCFTNDEKNRSRYLFLVTVIVIAIMATTTTTTGTTSYRIYFLESRNSPSQQRQHSSFRVFNFVGITVKFNNMVHERCDPIEKFKPDQSDIRFVCEGSRGGFIITSNIIYASQLF
jgi:hypothetical protein